MRVLKLLTIKLANRQIGKSTNRQIDKSTNRQIDKSSNCLFFWCKVTAVFFNRHCKSRQKNGFFGHFAVFANSCKIVHSAPSEALLRLKQQ